MRPLPDLSLLTTQPSVFDQQTDDWNTVFADEFSSSDSQQATLDQTVPGVYSAMDPLSQAIDAIGGIMNDAVNVFDILSGDLDSVNLDPMIQDYMAADASLDAGLDNPPLDFAAAAVSLYNTVFGIAFSTAVQFYDPLIDAINMIYWMASSALNQISQLWQYVE